MRDKTDEHNSAIALSADLSALDKTNSTIAGLKLRRYA